MIAELTPREAQVMRALADGLTNGAIARKLGIALPTVKTHLVWIYAKTGALNRAHAAAMAARRYG